jgi:hypothetical protein
MLFILYDVTSVENVLFAIVLPMDSKFSIILYQFVKMYNSSGIIDLTVQVDFFVSLGFGGAVGIKLGKTFGNIVGVSFGLPFPLKVSHS